jgi:hypothetical protein
MFLIEVKIWINNILDENLDNPILHYRKGETYSPTGSDLSVGARGGSWSHGVPFFFEKRDPATLNFIYLKLVQ